MNPIPPPCPGLTPSASLGRPGPDRVIITEDCRQAGQLTHTGAGGNKFVGCSGTN